MSDLTPGPAVDCDSDGIMPVAAEDEAFLSHECPNCGEHAQPIILTACDKGEDCDADEHDFGHGMHVEEVQ